MPRTRLKIVQPADGGVVREILAAEGAQVIAGEVLVRLDPALAQAELRALAGELAQRALQLRRIEAELDEAPIARHPGDDDEAFARADAQWRANRSAWLDAQGQEAAALARVERELAAASTQQEKLERTVPIHRTTAERYARLAAEGFVSELFALDRQREHIEREHDLAAQRHAVAALAAQREQAARRLAQVTSAYRQQLHAERAGAASQRARLAEELAKQHVRAEAVELRAPQAGIVKDLATHTIGTVVAAGTVLLTLVPAGDALEVALLVRLDPRQAVLFPAGSHEPLILDRGRFDATCAGGQLRTAPAVPAADASDDTGGASAATQGFGFRWFVPELAQHRRVWRDVLVASLRGPAHRPRDAAVTPVVIDRVVVPRTRRTPGGDRRRRCSPGSCSPAALGWVRQVPRLHTGNRVDAVLGAAVFEHLFRLPPPTSSTGRPACIGGAAERRRDDPRVRRRRRGHARARLPVPGGVRRRDALRTAVTLTLIALALPGAIVGVSLALAPAFPGAPRPPVLWRARDQAFVTEYVAGVETVKSLQIEPQLERRYGRLPRHLPRRAASRRGSWRATYHTRRPRRSSSCCRRWCSCAGAWHGDAAAGLHHRDAGRVPDVRARCRSRCCGSSASGSSSSRRRSR